MRTFFLASTIAVLGLAGTAQAHFNLMVPPEVVAGDGDGKGSPPCGPDTGAATMPTPAQGGHALMLNIRETVPHDGFYRVALALKSRSEFPVDNVVYDKTGAVLTPDKSVNKLSDHADSAANPVFPVLADNLFPHKGTAAMTFTGSVNLPNVSCDRCILQVIEFMAGHPFNPSVPPPGGGYFYHHCAELKITADPALPAFVAPGADGGAPDATTTTDAKMDAAGTSGAGGGGTAGATGTGGTGAAGSTVAGTAGAAGGTTGTAGSTTGAAGVTGTAGSPTGSAGSTGASGASGGRSSGGGGCALSGSAASRGGVLGSAVLLGLVGLARRRRRR